MTSQTDHQVSVATNKSLMNHLSTALATVDCVFRPGTFMTTHQTTTACLQWHLYHFDSSPTRTRSKTKLCLLDMLQWLFRSLGVKVKSANLFLFNVEGRLPWLSNSVLEYFLMVLLWRARLWCRCEDLFSVWIRMNKSPCIIHLPRIQFSVKILKKNNNEIILELMKSTNRSIDRCSFLVIWFICCLVSTPKLEYSPTFNNFLGSDISIWWFCLVRSVLQVKHLCLQVLVFLFYPVLRSRTLHLH